MGFGTSRGVFAVFWVAILLLVVAVLTPVGRYIWAFHQGSQRISIAKAIIRQPANYKAAGIAVARLCQSDQTLLAPMLNNRPPQWLPPAIGSLGVTDVFLQPNEGKAGLGGGFVDFFGIDVERDVANSTPTTNAWTVDLDNIEPSPGDPGRFTFTLPVTERVEADELVRDAVTELSRRKAAQAAGNDPALDPSIDNPVTDQKALVAAFPKSAAKLGFAPVPTPTASMPSTTRKSAE